MILGGRELPWWHLFKEVSLQNYQPSGRVKHSLFPLGVLRSKDRIRCWHSPGKVGISVRPLSYPYLVSMQAQWSWVEMRRFHLAHASTWVSTCNATYSCALESRPQPLRCYLTRQDEEHNRESRSHQAPLARRPWTDRATCRITALWPRAQDMTWG